MKETHKNNRWNHIAFVASSGERCEHSLLNAIVIIVALASTSLVIAMRFIYIYMFMQPANHAV